MLARNCGMRQGKPRIRARGCVKRCFDVRHAGEDAINALYVRVTGIHRGGGQIEAIAVLQHEVPPICFCSPSGAMLWASCRLARHSNVYVCSRSAGLRGRAR